MEGAVKFKPSCTSAALQENSRYAVVQRAPLKGKIAVHLRCSISGSVCEEGKKPKKQREAESDTRSSVDPIKKLLRYWRLNVSDALILPPPPLLRSNILLVCVLCISLANRRRGFSSVSFHPSLSLSFCFFRILRNEDRISTGCVRASELMNERGSNGEKEWLSVRMCFFWVV